MQKTILSSIYKILKIVFGTFLGRVKKFLLYILTLKLISELPLRMKQTLPWHLIALHAIFYVMLLLTSLLNYV